MPESTDSSSGRILKGLEEIRKLKPNYSDLLDFYEKIFIAQEDSANQTVIEPLKIPADTLALKVKERFPLIDISQFAIDSKAAGALFMNLCEIVRQSSGEMSESAKSIAESVKTGKLDLEALFAAFLKSDEDYFQKVSDELKIDKKTLGFIVYSSVKPSLTRCAEQLSTHFDKNQPWEKGYCPICGSPPAISIFEENGKRFFSCSFCWHKWATKRIFCPFCDNTDHNTLRYFEIESEEEHRLDVCDKCGKYIKTVDTRKTDRGIYPPLEYISTPHLDIKAAETGFKSGIEVGF